MAYSFVFHVGDGVTTNFSIPFSFLNRSHVYLKIDGVATSGFTWVNDGAITVSPAPADGANVLIYRDTPKDARLVDFSNESHLSAHNLDLSAEQIFFINQEEFDWARRGMDFIDDAQAAAESAEEHAGYAVEAANRAETLEANAELFMTRAETASNLAEVAKGLAIDAKDGAVVAKEQAVTAKDTTLTYRNDAQTAKDAAIVAKDAAVVAKDAALTAKTSAEGYASDAVLRASQALTSETNAAAYKNAAEAAKNTAVSAKDAALAAKTSAETAASQASGYKDTAVAARDTAIAAKDTAVAAKDAAVAAKADLETARDTALLAKNEAVSAATQASTAEAKAEKWANEAEDVEVEAGLYSAKHWSEKAKNYANAGSVPWNNVTDKPTTFPPATHNHDLLYAALAHNHTGVYAPATHSHAISNVTNLQTTLDEKAAVAHSHAGVYLDKTTDFVKTSGVIAQYGDITGFNSGLNAITGRLINIWDSQLDDSGTCAMIGFPHNKMAFLTERGGSVSFSPAISSGSAKNLFDGSGNYVYWANPTGNITVTITLPTAWSYMRMFMIQFYSDCFPTSFLVEYSKDGGTTWSTGFDITGWTRNYFCAPTNTYWYTTNTIRITFRAYNNASFLHICEIGWWNALEPIDSYSLSKARGGDVYGDINLPTGKYYKINGVPLAAADVGASAVEHNHTIANVTNLQATLDAKAASNHNHDTLYSALAHNHTGVYSASGHNHDSIYAAASHSHSYLANLSDDTSPELTGALDCNNKPVYWDIYTISGTTIDVANGNKQKLTLSTTNITVSLSTPSGACAFHLFIYQGATARTITWPTIKWLGGTAPDLAVSNGRFVVCLAWDGTTWFGSWGAYS